MLWGTEPKYSSCNEIYLGEGKSSADEFENWFECLKIDVDIR